ncbi:MAG: PEP-CTERM sorting domain-containing protein [Paucibacter sp.]|nr:PEP-CTERM sorting domain-containing protein [Roseateles sp.]
MNVIHKHRAFALKAISLAAVLALPAVAGAQVLTPGDLIVSGSFYQNVGQVAQLSAGSVLSGGTVATSNGQFQNVFLNAGADGSFGVTSQIFLQDYSLGASSASLNAQYNIDPNVAVNSFSSKSELGLNISSDGTALTFMGYTPVTSFSSTGTNGVAAVTTGGSNNLGLIDISNSNTPGVVDSANPVNASAYRTVVQLNLNSLSATATGTAGVYNLTGGVQSTQTNAYSGNNGRAAVLINGNYYMVGNAGNGSHNAALSQTTGVQMIAAGSTNPNTTVVGACSGTSTSGSGYQCGFNYGNYPGGTVDKTGKDNNFRGLDVYNGQMYVSKGSGGNGLNTVYQVSGYSSPSTATVTPVSAAGSTTGVPQVAGSSSYLGYTGTPFGIWQANATTMYVAYEGDGKQATTGTGVSTGPTGGMGGLAKFSLVNGNWSMDYMVQAGLNTSFQSTVVGGGNGMNYTDGLRNITGQVNADGTVTIYGVTSTVTDSTVSGSWDQGANPDQIVALTDTLANTTSTTNSFTVLQTSSGGEVFRGVALAPQAAAAVPEPETYALMLVGLGLLGGAVRRNQKRAA